MVSPRPRLTSSTKLSTITKLLNTKSITVTFARSTLRNPSMNTKTPTQQLLDFDETQPIPEPKEQPKLKANNPKELVRQWLLDKLQEESAEVIQAISKVRRFGEHNHHPERNTTNYEELVTELEDWLAIVAALEHTQYFDLTKQQHNILKKTQALIR